MAVSFVEVCYLNHQLERYVHRWFGKKGSGVQGASCMLEVSMECRSL